MSNPGESEEEVYMVNLGSDTVYVDDVIGHIEEIILSPEFQSLQNEFMEKHYTVFEDTEENKHEYLAIFQEYIATFERFLSAELLKRMGGFDMQRFAEELSKDPDYKALAENSEIFELLRSFEDFQTFKDIMVDYRNQKYSSNFNPGSDYLLGKSMQILNQNSRMDFGEEDR